MIFDFEPWQLDIDIDLTKQLYRSCKGDFVWRNMNVLLWFRRRRNNKAKEFENIRIIKVLELHTGDSWLSRLEDAGVWIF